MPQFPADFSLEPGQLFEGWTYQCVYAFKDLLAETAALAGSPVPELPPTPATHIAVFKRQNEGEDELVWMFNGMGPGPKFCLRNFRIAICPPELEPFTRATYGPTT
jgi:hypothetical protein